MSLLSVGFFATKKLIAMVRCLPQALNTEKAGETNVVFGEGGGSGG